MPYDGLTRISVCVLDEGGLLQVRGDEAQYPGVLPRLPRSLSIGDTVHVRVSMARREGPGDESLDLLGTVFLLEGGPGPVALKDGLIFEVDVSHMSRRAITDVADAARGPDARDERAAADDDVEELDDVDELDDVEAPAPIELAPAVDVADDDTLHASPLKAHPPSDVVESLDEQEALSGGPLSEELVEEVEELESPIHFRAVDVERREADPELQAELLVKPASDDDAVAEAADEDLDHAASLLALQALQARAEAPKPAPVLAADDVEAEAAAQQLLEAEDDGFGEDEVTAHERSGTRRSARSVFEATEPSGVVGTLREMALTEVVQSLEFAGKTAEIDVRPKGTDVPPGVLFLENGHVVYARCGTVEGEEAFFRLADQRRGAFLIRFHTKAPTRNIDQPTAYLLLEALRRTDEEAHERDLVERVAEEQARAEAAGAYAHDADDVDEIDEAADADRTLLSPPEDLGRTEPFGRVPSPPTEATRFERPPAMAAAAARGQRPLDVEYELDDEDMEDALIAVEEVQPAYAAREKRPYATAAPTTIFSRFFEEASEEEGFAPEVSPHEPDDLSDPTFSGLKAALKGLKRSDEDTMAAFDKPVSSGSFPSYS